MVISDWINILYPDEEEGWLTLNFFPNMATKWFRVGEEPPSFDIHQNCYMGIGARKERKQKGRGEFEDIIAIPGFWLDLDFDSEPGAHKAGSLPPNLEACIQLLNLAPHEPTLVVHSGHGLQAYWLFNEPWYFSDEEERKLAQRLGESWQSWFKAEAGKNGWTVDSTADLPRVFRIPGSYNCKTNNHILVEIICQSEKRYEPSDFDDFLITERPTLKSPQAITYDTGNKSEVNILHEKNVSDRIKYLIAHGDTLSRYASRSEAVFAVISSLTKAGYDDRKITEILLNPNYGISELPLEKGAKWVFQELVRARKKSPTSSENKEHPLRKMFDQASYSEITAAKHLIEEYGPGLHFIHRWKTWIVYRNGAWEKDESGTLDRQGKHIIASIGHEAKSWLSELLEVDENELIGMKSKQIDSISEDIAAKYGEEKYKEIIIQIGMARNLYAHSLKMTSKLSDIIGLARSEDGVHIPIESLDNHPFKLVCNNGVIDLTSGELMPFSPDYLITKRIDLDYDPNAKAPRWEQFLLELMGYPIGKDSPDMSANQLKERGLAESTSKELVEYLQRAVGYSLTGSVRDQVMFVLHGSGANGKSLFVSTLMKLFGKLSKKATQRLLMHKRNDHDHPTEVADLFGKRFVAAVETAEDQRLDEVFIKEATGDDVITARHMQEDFWEFRPTHKLWLATNHKPQIRDISYAMWRRLHLIPFNATFQMPDREESDPNLPMADLRLSDTLSDELQGILAWAVEGCILWNKNGLKPPKAVQDATDEYRKDQDVFGQFITECCIKESGCSASFAELWDAFKKWADDSNRHAGTKNAFGRRLGDRGYEKDTSSSQRRYKGIRLQ